MSLKVCVLASGSRGNCILIQSSKTAVLIDAGLSGRETLRRLDQLGERIEEVEAVLVGHEHGDHTRGLRVLVRKHSRPVFMNRETAEALGDPDLEPNIFTNGRPLTIGDLTVLPFSVFHDARDPVGFTVQAGTIKVTVATDLGMPSRVIADKLKGARLVILEANYDHSLLMNGGRPWALKQRIKSSQGHLSNQAAADLISGETDENLTDVFLAHLSRDCNRPDLAVRAVEGELKRAGKGHVRVRVTYQDRLSEVVEAVEKDRSVGLSARTGPEAVQLSWSF